MAERYSAGVVDPVAWWDSLPPASQVLLLAMERIRVAEEDAAATA